MTARQRTIAACHADAARFRWRDDGPPAPEPNFSLDRQLAQARREMGEERWAQRNAEWENPNV